MLIKIIRMYSRVILLIFPIIIGSNLCVAQEIDDSADPSISPFIAYDFGEAIFNKFQSLSGEIGVILPNHHLIRLVHQNVELTEEHLSSDFAIPVKGDNVEGSLFGFETFYSFPLKKWKGAKEILYISPSLGYYKNEYRHTILEDRFEKSSMTAGVEISYRQTDLFKIKGLYYTLAIPIRIHFTPHEEFKLGDTRILGNRLDNNIWFMLGYQF